MQVRPISYPSPDGLPDPQLKFLGGSSELVGEKQLEVSHLRSDVCLELGTEQP